MDWLRILIVSVFYMFALMLFCGFLSVVYLIIDAIVRKVRKPKEYRTHFEDPE